MTKLDFVLLFAAGQLKEGKNTTVNRDVPSIRPLRIDVVLLRPNGQLRYPSTVSTPIMKRVFLAKGIYYYPQTFRELFSTEGSWSTSKDRIKN